MPPSSYPRIKPGKGSVQFGPTVFQNMASKQVLPNPPPSPKAVALATKRRMDKAERDERMDITKALTPVKTYMGGFTRPQDLRISNWWPGGAYLASGKVYEIPPAAAYEPHTVFLLEARYVTKHGHGRCDSIEHIVGVCREGDLPAIVEFYNSPQCPREAKEIMDNARWPWTKQKTTGPVRWWEKTEDLKTVLRERELEIYGTEGVDAAKDQATTGQRNGESAVDPSFVVRVVGSAPSSSMSGVQRRAFHHSTRVSSDDNEKTRTTPAERAEIPTSSWARPHKPSQDASDDVVPAYYIERKRQLDEIAERKEAEGSLMAQLSAGILSEGIAAQTRVREGKIPAEIIDEDGTVRLASGFEVPTPATEFHPAVAMPPPETDEPLVKDGKTPWEEALAPADEPVAPSASSSSSVGTLGGVRKFHTSAIARAREVPMDFARRVEPPHKPAQPASVKTKAPAAPATSKKAAPRSQENQTENVEEDEEEFDEEGIMDLSEGVPSVTDTPADFDAALKEHRERYMATLKEKPYWRPVLTATFSTRPLALTYARLARGLPRGLPYYASIEEDDRKLMKTYNGRMKELRWARMRSLAFEMAKRLRGDAGGFPGIRFDVNQRGRGINGENLEAPIPDDKRIIQFGLGAWHPRHEEYRELFESELEELELQNGFEVFAIDEWGKRLDGKEWRKPVMPLPRKMNLLKLAVEDEQSLNNLTLRQKNEKLNAVALEHGRAFAYAMAQKKYSVHYPPNAQHQVKMEDYVEGKVPLPESVAKKPGVKADVKRYE